MDNMTTICAAANRPGSGIKDGLVAEAGRK